MAATESDTGVERRERIAGWLLMTTEAALGQPGPAREIADSLVGALELYRRAVPNMLQKFAARYGVEVTLPDWLAAGNDPQRPSENARDA
jgi:hypothetical protein